MPTCSECGKYTADQKPPPKFCVHCAAPFNEGEPVLYARKATDSGVYRITYDPVEGEFLGADHATEEASEAHWGPDREFGDFTIELVRSTVPKDEYPYICGTCGSFVTDDTTSLCSECDEVNWVERE